MMFQGHTAIAFSNEDIIAPAKKLLQHFAKEAPA